MCFEGLLNFQESMIYLLIENKRWDYKDKTLFVMEEIKLWVNIIFIMMSQNIVERLILIQ